MAGLENIGNLWDQLSELHQKDPQKYQEVIEESAKEYAKLKLPPLPHTCILVREKVILTRLKMLFRSKTAIKSHF